MKHTSIPSTRNLSPNGYGFQKAVELKKRPWFAATIKSLLLIFLPAVLFFSKAVAQTFPSPSSCTSKDLTLTGATLPGTDLCNTCIAGDSVYRTLRLSIFNKTGSTRTSFAFWGTLEIRNADGSSSSSTSISGCGGPVARNTTTTLSFNQVGYVCGQSLTIKNLFLAWTDASPGSTCPLNSALIAPKCGTLDSIRINTGLDASFTVTNATCTVNGSINMTPLGGKAPYSYSWSASEGGVVPTGQSTNEDLTNLVAGKYTVTVTDANNCTATRFTTVSAPTPVSTPTATVTQPTCATATGSVSVNSFDNTITYTLKQGGDVKYTANASGVFSAVATGTYDLVATKGSCSATGSVAVNAQPATPDAPSASVTQPTCSVATGTITVTAPVGDGLTYSIGGAYQSSPIFNNVAPGDYNVTAQANGCTSGTTSKTVNPQPATPGTPSANVDQPTCSVATGTITVTAPVGDGITYSIGGAYQSSPIFNNVAPGDYQVTAQANGCTSSATQKTVNAAPQTPDAPSVCIVQPSLCGPATGSVSVTSPLGAGFEYSILNGIEGSWQTSNVFPDVAAGSVTGIKVKNADGCISAAADCDASSCAAARSQTTTSTQNKTGTSVNTLTDLKVSEPTVKAFPNPFGSNVKFVVTVPEAGNGSLEVLNLLGQKVKTVFQGRMPAGANTFEVNLPSMQSSQLIYILRMGDKHITGKLLQLNQ